MSAQDNLSPAQGAMKWARRIDESGNVSYRSGDLEIRKVMTSGRARDFYATSGRPEARYELHDMSKPRREQRVHSGAEKLSWAKEMAEGYAKRNAEK